MTFHYATKHCRFFSRPCTLYRLALTISRHALTSSLFLRKSFLFTENGTFWDFRGKFFANQVIKVICILQFFIDSYTSDEKSLFSKSLFLCVSILMFFSYLKFIFLILGLYTLWAIIIIMKQLFIIIIIAQRLYGSKIQKKFRHEGKCSRRIHKKELLPDRLFSSDI